MGPLIHQICPRAAGDPFVPVLAERLAALSRAGLDAAGLLRQAHGEGPLPDDHALCRGWTITDLAATTTPTGTDLDVEEAQAMTLRIAMLTDPPPHADPPEDPLEPVPPEDLDWPAPDVGVHHQPTDAEWQALLAEPEEPTAEDPGPVPVHQALAAEAYTRDLLTRVGPSESELDRLYEREQQIRHSPVPLTRMAEVNALALTFYLVRTDRIFRSMPASRLTKGGQVCWWSGLGGEAESVSSQ